MKGHPSIPKPQKIHSSRVFTPGNHHFCRKAKP
jgi:hypothetical protein